MDRPHKPRTLLSIQLDNGPSRLRRGLYLRVVHSQAAEDGLWSVGCSFVTPLEAEELRELIACSSSQATGLTAELKAAAQQRAAAEAESVRPAGPPSCPAPPVPVQTACSHPSPPELAVASTSVAASGEQEKRRSPRRGASLTVVQITRPGSWSRPVEGWVVNKSLGGMCLCSPRRFDAQTLLEVRPKRSPNPKSKVELRVLETREQGGRYMLHCQFVSHPPTDVFQLL
jgi:hypothetical protein